MAPKREHASGSQPVPRQRHSIGHPGSGPHGSSNQFDHSESRLVSLRHHPSVWLLPASLLILALLPWPYGYYNFLRLIVCAVSSWIAYTQWRHDDALSGWVIAMGATSVLYNPFLPVYLTREIWSILNLISAGLFVGHLWVLRLLVNGPSPAGSNARKQRLVGTPAHRVKQARRRALKSDKTRSN